MRRRCYAGCLLKILLRRRIVAGVPFQFFCLAQEVGLRAKPGVTLNRAQSEMDTIQSRIGEVHPADLIGSQVVAVPLLEQTPWAGSAQGSADLVGCGGVRVTDRLRESS